MCSDSIFLVQNLELYKGMSWIIAVAVEEVIWNAKF